jgi:rSAM/selenodomain-associated transferase 1
MKKNNALIILAKYPDPDEVKTRLIGSMPDKKRLELYVYLLDNTVRKLMTVPGVDSFISYSPRSSERYFSGFGLEVFPQSEGDIGERMFNAINLVLGSSYQRAVLVGVDIPDISDMIVLKAFELLLDCDIVFGPVRDGGYYLVGLKTPIREIFRDVEWSTEKTLKQSMEIASACGYRVALTETLDDIDTIEDVNKAGFLF